VLQRRCIASGATFRGRVFTVAPQIALRSCQLARLRQRDVQIRAESEIVLRVAGPVSKDPRFAAGRLHSKVKAAAVRQHGRSRRRFRCLRLSRRETFKHPGRESFRRGNP